MQLPKFHQTAKRKQTAKKQPASRYHAALNKLTFFAGIAAPLTILPQIYNTYTTQSAAGLSLASWVLITIVTFPWILYGIAHRDKTILASFTLWEIVNITMVFGILLYG